MRTLWTFLPLHKVSFTDLVPYAQGQAPPSTPPHINLNWQYFKVDFTGAHRLPILRMSGWLGGGRGGDNVTRNKKNIRAMAPRQPVFLPGLRHPDNRSFYPSH